LGCISLFVRFDALPFFSRLIKEEDEMRRRKEINAFQETTATAFRRTCA